MVALFLLLAKTIKCSISINFNKRGYSGKEVCQCQILNDVKPAPPSSMKVRKLARRVRIPHTPKGVHMLEPDPS